jgi:hypothetical protein
MEARSEEKIRSRFKRGWKTTTITFASKKEIVIVRAPFYLPYVCSTLRRRAERSREYGSHGAELFGRHGERTCQEMGSEVREKAG